MENPRTFHIEIIGGKIAWKSDYQRDLFYKWVSGFSDGKYLFEIVQKKEKRSAQQNRYYHFYLGLIARESGHTKDELHSFFKGRFLTDHISEIFGRKTRITRSTTELTRGEFCEYLANISLETGVELPDTTSYYGYSYHK